MPLLAPETKPRTIEELPPRHRCGARVRSHPGARRNPSGSLPWRAATLALATLALLGATLPASLHGPLLLRLRAYDRRVAPDAALRVLLVDDGLDPSQRFQDELATALRAAAKGGAAPTILRATLGEGLVLGPAASDGPLVVVLAPGLSTRVAELRAALGATPVLTIGSDEASVRAGLALGVVRAGDRPAVLVNRAAAAAEGARLDAGLLRLAHTVDAAPGAP